MVLLIPNRVSPKCPHCEDTHTCEKCAGFGEIASRYFSYASECDECSGEGMCRECCCPRCTEVGQVPCRCDEDDE